MSKRRKYKKLQQRNFVATDNLKHLVHGYFLYQCEKCGAIYKMWLDKGLEDNLQDKHCPDKHKPVPFYIFCRSCNNGFAQHILWGFGDSDDYTELPKGANYFKNDKKEDYGKAVVSIPDAINLEHFMQLEVET